jgi:acetyl esterase
VEATANPPYLADLGPVEGRKVVDSVQGGDIPAPAADTEDLIIPGGPQGEVSVKIYRPAGASGPLPVLIYTHGAGWVFGDAHTHDRLVRELTVRSGAATVFVNYGLSPEHRYPNAIEEIYATLEWVAKEGAGHRLDSSRIAVAGDSVGGNMTAALTIMAKQRSGPRISAQLLYYPVTDASFDTDQVPSNTALRTARPMAPRPGPLLTVTLMEDGLIPAWGTQEPKEQADVLAKLSAWLQDERTKIEAL